MAFLGNVIWFIFAGWSLGLSWLVAAAVACVTIVLIPYAPACLRLAGFSAVPFGREIVDQPFSDPPTHTVRTGLNVVWFLLVGWWLWIGHVIWGIALCLTLIGIPFGIQAFKIAGAALSPVGKDVVRK